MDAMFNIPTLIVLLVVAVLLAAAIRRIRKKGACDCGECTDCDKDLTSCGHAGVCSSCPHKETPHGADHGPKNAGHGPKNAGHDGRE